MIFNLCCAVELRRIFNLAIEPREYLVAGKNPFAKIKRRKTTSKPLRYVSIDEYQSLLTKATRLWWETLISLAYGSGLRCKEILHLTWADIDFETKLIRVCIKSKRDGLIPWEPKGRRNRNVPLADEAIQLLVNMQGSASEKHPYIFISPERLRRIRERQKRGKWTPQSEVINNLLRAFNCIRRRAGVDTCTLHDLRRSAITNWAHVLPIHVVQELAGHESISTTRKYYLAVRPGDMKIAANAINAALEIQKAASENETDTKMTQMA